MIDTTDILYVECADWKWRHTLTVSFSGVRDRIRVFKRRCSGIVSMEEC